MNDEKLQPKEQIFVKEFLVDLDAPAAAIRAGYSPKAARNQGYEILKRSRIQRAIKKAMDERSKRTEVSADFVLTNLVELTKRCMQKVPVMVYSKFDKGFVQAHEEVEHDDGSITSEGVWKFDALGANKALRSLGDHLGLFKVVHTNDPDNPIPAGSNVIFYIPENGRIKNPNNKTASGLSGGVSK